MSMKVKHKCDINIKGSRHGHKFSKYKICLSLMMTLCVKQQLNKVWSTIMKTLRKAEAELKTRVAYKKACRFKKKWNISLKDPKMSKHNSEAATGAFLLRKAVIKNFATIKISYFL